MSEVKRYGHIGSLVTTSTALLEIYPSMSVYVLARDYDDAKSELAALREELARVNSSWHDMKRSSDIDKQRLTAAEQRNAATASTLEECITEMSLALQDHAVRSAMTVIGRTRFLKLIQDYNTKPTESGASE